VRDYRFDEVDTLSYSTFERVLYDRRLGERVERPEDLPAAIERSLTVMPRARATRSSTLSAVSGAETNLLAASAPA